MLTYVGLKDKTMLSLGIFATQKGIGEGRGRGRRMIFQDLCGTLIESH